ncbi:uncharacterized protein LOC110463647 [Mizuhopecten yessoensis]|uniref:ParB/Sulfiredoxin domain-containing protein n=1 Tax=Mizuhopecten yessoensis TaxID=6573 RepID=A0A210PVQ3_MIZYE|nr:uncharacterized protein LOC110463647 [Mizuhopecten yessoensis]OWF40554.1 hypothetical protein KP79_PYT19988 [Mizuhopecten yessoensis]
MTMGVEHMRPSELRFTHNSVSYKFTDGHTLDETFRQLLNDELRIARGEMPPLVAMHYNGHWFVVRGNRRLYLLRKLEEVGKFQTVKVVKREFEETLFNKQFTSQNMGTSIRIRGDPFIEEKLRQCINDWQNSRTRPHSTSSASTRMYGLGGSPNFSTSNYSYSPPPRASPVRSYTPPPRIQPAKQDDSWCVIL